MSESARQPLPHRTAHIRVPHLFSPSVTACSQSDNDFVLALELCRDFHFFLFILMILQSFLFSFFAEQLHPKQCCAKNSCQDNAHCHSTTIQKVKGPRYKVTSGVERQKTGLSLHPVLILSCPHNSFSCPDSAHLLRIAFIIRDEN